MTSTEGVEKCTECNGAGTPLRRAQLRLLDMLVEFHRICEKHGIKYYISGGTCLGAVRHGGFIPWDDDVDIDIWYTDYARLMEILPKELPNKYKLQTVQSDAGFYCQAARLVDCNSRVIYPNNNFVRRKFAYQGLFIDLLPIAPAPSLSIKRFIDKFGSVSFSKKKSGAVSDCKTYIGWVLWPAMIPLIGAYKFAARHSKSTNATHYHASIAPTTPHLVTEEIFPVQPLMFEGHEVYGPNNPEAYLTRLYGDFSIIPTLSNRRAHAVDLEVF